MPKIPKRFTRSRAPLWQDTKFSDTQVKSPTPSSQRSKRVTKSKCAQYFDGTNPHNPDNSLIDKIHNALCLHDVIQKYKREYTLAKDLQTMRRQQTTGIYNNYADGYDIRQHKKGIDYFGNLEDQNVIIHAPKITDRKLKTAEAKKKFLEDKINSYKDELTHLDDIVKPLLKEGYAYVDMYNSIWRDILSNNPDMKYISKYIPKWQDEDEPFTRKMIHRNGNNLIIPRD